MTELFVRLYQHSDRQAVHNIGAETAFFGSAVENLIDDRNAFLDAFYTYYTDYEPEHLWVACAGDQVVGFLTGCVDTRLRDRRIVRSITLRLAGNLLCGKYRVGKRTMKYSLGMLAGAVRGEFTRVDLHAYPAHLHINVDSEWRGNQLGFKLMDAYLQQLRDLLIPGVFLDTTSLNEIACRLYEKMGFRLLDSRPNRYWSRWFGHPVENLCYGLKLSD